MGHLATGLRRGLPRGIAGRRGWQSLADEFAEGVLRALREASLEDRAAAGEVEPAERVSACELEDLRRAGPEDQLSNALVPGLEHRGVEGEFVALQPVLPQDLLESGVGAD